MTYLIWDLETTTKEVYGRIANPFLNKIVASGYKTSTKHFADFTSNKECVVAYMPTESQVLVGHNIKFDLLYVWEEIQHKFRLGVKIWDTQLAHYLLSGQQEKYPALRDIAVRCYGCVERPKVMEEYWDKDTIKLLNWSTKKIIKTFPKNTDKIEIARWADANKAGSVDIVCGHIDTKDIPRDLVEYDVLNDVADTESIYLQQLQKAQELGMTKLIENQMEYLLATTEAEWNGIQVNKKTLLDNKKGLELELEATKQELMEIVKGYWK